MLQRNTWGFARYARPALIASTMLCGIASQPAWASCTADSAGTTVTCSGTSATYVDTTSGISLTADSTATVTGPVILGDSANVTNEGTINAASTGYALQVGDGSTVTNNGTITSAYSTTTSGGISLGADSTLINNGSLTAISGTYVAKFDENGTFINNSSATAAITGYISYGVNVGSDVATFENYSTSYGYSGLLTSSGNTSIYNDGIFTGSFTQTATLGTVNIVNDTDGTYTGYISTGDVTTLTNNGTLTLYSASALGTLRQAGTSLTNNGSFTIGTSTTASSVTVYGSYTQSADAELNVTITSSSTGSPVAGSSYSQLRAYGDTGTATLAGTLNVTATAGFYPTGSTYDIVVADQGITGDFSTITGNELDFITFVPIGIVTLSDGTTAYELQVERTQTYAEAIASVATANQLAVATAFQPMVDYATADPTGDEATLVGEVDVLTVAEAQSFFDSLSPAGYGAYADALRDQANMFQRQVALRMSDQNSNHGEQGPWLTAGHTLHLGSANGDKTTQAMTFIQGGYDFSGPHFVVGASLGYSYDNLDYAPGTLSGHNSETQVGAYGAYHLGPVVASGQISYQFGSLNSSKTIVIGSDTRTAGASASNHLLSVSGTLGFDLEAGDFAFSPFAGVMYSKGSISPFTETGADTANLTVSRIDASRTDLIAGATLTKARGKWRPFARVNYRSKIGSGGSDTITAYMDGETDTTFTVDTLTASKQEVDADVGLNIVFNDEGGLYLAYQGTYRSDVKTHGIMAGIRIEF